MEDKRTLLAFLAIGLILLGLPYYYDWMGMGRPQRTPARPAPAADQVAPAAAQPAPMGHQEEAQAGPASAPPSAPAIAEQVATAPPREIVVRTLMQEVVFSTTGGAITSCRLPAYRLVSGGAVELVPEGALGLVVALEGLSHTESLAETVFQASVDSLVVAAGSEGVLRLAAELGQGRRVEKVLTFRGDQYGFDLEVRYAGLDGDTQVLVGWQGGIAPTERQPSIDVGEARALAYFNGSLNTVRAKSAGKTESWSDKGPLQWAGVRSKYFLVALAPRGEERQSVALEGVGAAKDQMPTYSLQVGAEATAEGRWRALVYAGPLNYQTLSAQGASLEQAIDFGWPVVRQISQLLLIVFRAAYAYIPNYGWIIVVFAVAIKVLVYPLTHKTYESTTRMQELQPKIAALRERFKSDPQRLSRETMKLYKEQGVNPLGGCLPLVLQMPIFFALYNLFGRTIELRQAPFVLWIDDLSVPDQVLVGGLSVHVLPLLMAVSMLVQQKMTMKDPKQAFMVYLMPVVMTFIFWNMTSGLVLYWTVFNVLTIGQQLLVEYVRRSRPAAAN